MGPGHDVETTIYIVVPANMISTYYARILLTSVCMLIAVGSRLLVRTFQT